MVTDLLFERERILPHDPSGLPRGYQLNVFGFVEGEEYGFSLHFPNAIPLEDFEREFLASWLFSGWGH